MAASRYLREVCHSICVCCRKRSNIRAKRQRVYCCYMSSAQTIYPLEFYAFHLRAVVGFPDYHNAIKNIFLPPYCEIASVWAESNRLQCLLFLIVHNLSQRYMSNHLVTDGIPYLRGSIITPGGKVTSIRAESHSIHNAIVSEASHFLTTGSFPDPCSVISTCGGEVATIWTKCHRSNIPSLM